MSGPSESTLPWASHDDGDNDGGDDDDDIIWLLLSTEYFSKWFTNINSLNTHNLWIRYLWGRDFYYSLFTEERVRPRGFNNLLCCTAPVWQSSDLNKSRLDPKPSIALSPRTVKEPFFSCNSICDPKHSMYLSIKKFMVQFITLYIKCLEANKV